MSLHINSWKYNNLVCPELPYIFLFLLDDLTKRQKILAINRVLKTEPVDVETLKQLCISRGGLLSDEIRKKAWPKLLQVDVGNILDKPGIYTLR